MQEGRSVNQVGPGVVEGQLTWPDMSRFGKIGVHFGVAAEHHVRVGQVDVGPPKRLNELRGGIGIDLVKELVVGENALQFVACREVKTRPRHLPGPRKRDLPSG